MLRGSQERSRGIIRGDRDLGLFRRLLLRRSSMGIWVWPRGSRGLVVGGLDGPGIGPRVRGVLQAIGGITGEGECSNEGKCSREYE